ncbi:SDR family NAD(P)-dependent oxidoreductase [Amycolatopsis rhizosphaerae]|uniref:SDR family NAD(P)-dependent oxidoreductase n=1 Tax=Amycolatopsis rhizosphaerae TaxID=2053003 RepID=A0A558DHR8_9PSEU|nr:SDR family NAD(P)-dependent oxidoreductase [Amycolatopsis rhizosphaerae]TVT60568.1 SDR family NAD(P)-dependent oxidoreductase [Amycolatopsis rhizosphaerae]
MTAQRIALVTGANQGLGFALAEGLAAGLGPEDLVLLTGRDERRVADAAALVANAPGTKSRVEGRVLDVSDADAVARMAAELERAYGGVDIVLSNASARITPDRSQAEQADAFVAVANGGTHAILRSFGPVLRPGGRLLVVASSLGMLGRLDPRLHHLFEGATLDRVEQVVEAWLKAIHDGTAESLGWPAWINVPSKVAQVAAVRAVAAQRRERDLTDGTLIAAVCPGLIDTAASRPWFDDFSQAQTPEQAARALLDLVFAKEIDPKQYGELVRFGQVMPWTGGAPSEYQDELVKRG